MSGAAGPGSSVPHPGGIARGEGGAARASAAAAASEAMDRRVARVLGVGVSASVLLLAIGAVLLIASGRSPLDEAWPAFDPSRLLSDLRALRPEGFLWLGLITILATPSLRVATAIAGFLTTGERRMAGLGAAVLAIVALAVVAGTALG